jgi:hypothetical protein
LAQLPGSVLAIAGEVHAASHEAGRLADTKHPGWHPVGKSRSGQVGVREAVRATTRVMSGNSSAQYPAQLPGNYRESAEQCSGNISCGIPRIIHAVSNESSGCLPGNCRAVSGQRPRSSRAIAGGCPRNVHAIARFSPRGIQQCPQTRSVHVRVQSVN